MSRAVERSVNNFESVRHSGNRFAVNRLRKDVLQELFVGYLSDCFNKSLTHRFGEKHSFYAGKNVYMRHSVGNGLCVLRRKLCSIRPINLVSVVFLRVMACGDIYACHCAVSAYGKAELRRRAHIVEDANIYAVCRHNGSRGARKKLTVDTAVVADYNAALHGLRSFGADNRGKGLRSVANNMSVHAV